MKTIEHYKELAKQYNKINKDKDRLIFLKNHKEDTTVVLDNDRTEVSFLLPEDMDEDLQELIRDIDLNPFNDYHGWTDAVVELFQFAGINAEVC